jgi:hypothetical protein
MAMNQYQVKKEFIQEVFNVIPLIVLVVDDDVRIQLLNNEAEKTISYNSEYVLKKRGGDVFHCIHSRENENGCGSAEFCKDCIIRNSVKASINGKHIHREKVKMELVKDEQVENVYFSITASPFEYEGKNLVLLVLENISDLLQLKNLLPMCSRCNKVRDDKEYWVSVESYLKLNLDQMTTHSLCPECVLKVYPDYFMKMH